MKRMFTALAVASAVMASANSAMAFDCTNQFSAAEDAIKTATGAMNKISDKQAKGTVHTLIDDAKMLLNSAKHNHENPAAGKYDHARSMAKAGAAKAAARAATVLAGKV